ncbi:MAG: CheR family methyltransferase [Rhodospirillaceae bacterium]
MPDALLLETPTLGEREFKHLAHLVENYSGIRMPPGKRTMLEGRLRRRLRERRMADFREYCRYLASDGGLDEELGDLIDVVTTNKTDFFREPKHFEILTGSVLSTLTARGIGQRRPLHVWSAGSSIGAEAYTLAMVLAEYGLSCPGFDFRILGTDLCTTVLEAAALAVYPEEMIEPVPLPLRRRYLMRSREPKGKTVRVIPELRAKAAFHRLNFMDAEYKSIGAQDIVFFRNVMIYFDNQTREAVLSRICACIASGGYLFIGHSETISGFDLPLRQIAPTVYVRI